MSLIDLTLSIREGMPTYPAHWHPRVEINQLGRIGIEGRETRRLVMGTHTGTHVDAPRHFIEGGATIDEIPLDRLCGPASMVDLCDCSENLVISDKRLAEAAPRPVMVLRFGWDKHWGTMAYYHGHPYLSGPAVKLLISRGCKVLAMDTPSPDQSDNQFMPAHKVLLREGIILVEGLSGLGRIPSAPFDLIVAPLKIQGGDGAPARVFAIV